LSGKVENVKTKELGHTGVQVPIVGIGTAFLGFNAPEEAAAGKVEIDEDAGVRAVHAAIGAGSTLIDTSPFYGGTRAETILGRALRERPDLAAQCVIVSKAGRRREGKDYSRDAIRRSVFESLDRLGLERLELVSVHDAQEHDPSEVLGKGGALEALRELQSEGIVGHVGVACSDPETNAGYVETGEFEVATVADAWSLLTQLMADRILPAAEKYRMGIIIATPLERGLLATGPIPGRPYQSRNFSQDVLDHVARIQSICKKYSVSLLAVSLQWLTRHPQVSSAVPGARSPEEAIANATAAAEEVPIELWSELDPLIAKHIDVDRGKMIVYRG
jgi:D-threo-aldose 1-dehydrogenase